MTRFHRDFSGNGDLDLDLDLVSIPVQDREEGFLNPQGGPTTIIEAIKISIKKHFIEKANNHLCGELDNFIDRVVYINFYKIYIGQDFYEIDKKKILDMNKRSLPIIYHYLFENHFLDLCLYLT